MSPHPFDRLKEIRGPALLLYAADEKSGWGAQSLLAHRPQKIISGDKLQPDDLNERSFGYLGYPLRHLTETLTPTPEAYIPMPACWLMQPEAVERFDPVPLPSLSAHQPPAIAELASNMSKEDYLQIIDETLEAIRAGAFYQANITRKFYGRFDHAPDAKALFRALCAISPMPYAAFIDTGESQILSASPEGFLQVETGRAIVRPMKGSAPRSDDPARDAALKAALAASDKDRAENLMIVDLMRNDLSRVAAPVTVPALQEVYSYPGIHQMISTVEGRLLPGKSPLDAALACFPPGSMTGAPKLAAMEWCAAKEKLERGVYSGALGWIAPEGCNLSVVIRTLILQGDRFEFQVGGGIVADSDPLAEWEESLLKAKPIAALLGIPMEQLRAL